MGRAYDVSIEFLGAAGTVSGSKHLIRIVRKGAKSKDDQLMIMIDCGMFQGLKQLREKNWEPISADENIEADTDFIIITHCHLDHIGYLPRMVNEGFKGTIYATPETFNVMGITLADAAHLQEEDAKYENKYGGSSHTPALPLFTQKDVDKALEFVEVLQKKNLKTIEKNGLAVSFRFHDAGHILGSTFVEIWLDNEDSSTGRKMIFSGDLGSFKHNIPLQSTPDIPSKDFDYVATESTYGNRIHMEANDKRMLEDLLKPQLKEAVEYVHSHKGSILVPAFAIGRSQHLAYMFLKMMKDGDIPEIPIFLNSPMAVKALELYKNYCKGAGEHDAAALLDKVKISETTNDSKSLVATTQNALKAGESRIIISSSGMMAGGRVLHHAKDMLPGAQNVILLTGYQAAGTRGKELQDGVKEMKIFGQKVAVKSKIVTLKGVSGHGDYQDIIGKWMSNLIAGRRLRQVFVIHGEPTSSKEFAHQVTLAAPHVSVAIPSKESVFFLPEHSGTTVAPALHVSASASSSKDELLVSKKHVKLPAETPTVVLTAPSPVSTPVSTATPVTPSTSLQTKVILETESSDDEHTPHKLKKAAKHHHAATPMVIEREPIVFGQLKLSQFTILLLSLLVMVLALRR